jgi:exopolyphosphatase/guanosine-5'-triphosphate,3'-diphosphate pyrophosphatase
MAKYKTFAAVDVGSTAISMKIFELARHAPMRQIDYIRHNIPLGGETYNIGKISYELVEETCSVLKEFVRIMQEYQVDSYTAYATSAVREAQNSAYILDQILLRTGLKVTILSNEEERFLHNKALSFQMKNFNQVIESGAAIVDIGSGSIQISVYEKSKLCSTQNIRLGSLRILELLSTLEGQTSTFGSLLEEYIETNVNVYRRLYLQDAVYGNFIAVGGEVEYIKAVCKKPKDSYLSVEDFEEAYAILRQTSVEDVCNTYAIPYQDAMLLLPAVMTYKKFIDLLMPKAIFTPELGLTDGIAVEFAEANKYFESDHDFSGDILSSARFCAQKYHCDRKHEADVEKKAVVIFNALSKSFGLGKRDRLLLRIAAILHDTGLFLNLNHYSKYSCSIVQSYDILGLSEKEHQIVAYTTLYHAKNIFEDDYIYHSFSKSRKLLISKLTAILALAKALDAAHTQKISDIHVSLRENRLLVTAQTDEDITMEKWQFQTAGGFFEEVFGVKPSLKQKRTQ